MKKKPLVSFWIPVYNQERFIRESVESALAQTYRPLEIVISDDCSSDRSFDIVKEVVSKYQGPHKIILNRNPVNLGIGGHENKKKELVHGDFITGCAGDDIAMPDKVEIMVERWLSSGKKKNLFFSNAVIIDELGNECGLYYKFPPRYSATLDDFINDRRSRLAKIIEPSVWVLGATSGVARYKTSYFGEISPKVMQEDAVLSFRSLLMGGMEYIDKPLVKYRVHNNSLSSKTNYHSVALLQSREYYYVKQQIADARLFDVPKAVFVELGKNLAVALAKKMIFQIPFINTKLVACIKYWNNRRKK